MKKIIFILFISIPSYCQDDIKNTVNELFRIISSSTKTLDNSNLKDIIAEEHTFINDYNYQSIFDYSKKLIEESINVTMISKVEKFIKIDNYGNQAFVLVFGTDRLRIKNKETKNNFIGSFLLVYDSKRKKWLIKDIHISNEK